MSIFQKALLAGEFDDSILTNNVNLYFTGIFQLLLNTLGDVSRKLMHAEVGYLAWIHKNANFTSCGDSIDLLNSFKPARNALKVAQSLEVSLYRVATSTWPSSRHAIRHLHNHRFWSFVGIFLV